MTQVSYDLQTLEIETFAVESLEGLGVNAALCSESSIAHHGASPDLTICTTSSTTSSSCG